MTFDGSHSYDDENRLTQVDSGTTATYVYDVDGRRVEKSVSGTRIDYIYSPSGNVVAEINPGWVRGYVYAGGAEVAEYYDSTTYFLHRDHLGSARILTGVNQAVVQNLDYYPYGELNSTDSGITTHKFTGDERDAETNLDHTQFRQYSSSTARWMTPDPAGLAAVDPSNPQSWNRYAYVLNNPLRNIDPLGLSCITFDDGTEGDNGDGLGCAGAGVAPGSPNDPNTISPDQVNVQAQNPSNWEYFWAISTNTLPIYVPNDVPLSPSSQRYAQAIANALPTVCGGGVFYYTGREVDTGAANGFAGEINEYDTRTGFSGGLLFEGGAGEGIQGGAGVIVSGNGPGGSMKGGIGTSGLAYGGFGVGTPVASASGGLVGFSSGAGIYADGSLFTHAAGGGAYLNITTVGGCHP